MKRIGFLLIALAICASLTVSGCSSAQKKLSEDVKGIKTKVDTLETRVEGVETKQAETDRLAMEQAQKAEEMKASSGRSNVEIKHRHSSKDKDRTREIQACLKNAGFYKGNIDGVKGKSTKKAIKKFQKANGLKADGVVGAKTWELLSKYLAGSPAAAPASADSKEGANTK